MVTRGWSEVPRSVQLAAERHIGPVAVATDISGGSNCDLAAVVHAQAVGRPVFVKGVRGVGPQMRWLRNEAAAGALALGVAPAVLFSEDADDWLIVGFDYVHGRPAYLAPGSADLPLVAATVDRIGSLPAPGLRTLRDRWSVTDWWDRLAAIRPDLVDGWDVGEASRWSAALPVFVDGDRLVHTDLHGDQFVIAMDRSVHVIDWGWPAAGAAWVDAAFLVLRLIEAGHDAAQAEAWAKSLECWPMVGDTTLSAFAVFVAGLWSYRAATGTVPGADRRAAVARSYAAWRLHMPVVGG